MDKRTLIFVLCCAGLTACATTEYQGTPAELQKVEADVDEVYLEDSLERAAESYRRYLNETPKSARTPEAMRRLADLQIEQAYGVMGSGDVVEMATPEAAVIASPTIAAQKANGPAEPLESEKEFEHRATGREALLGGTTELDMQTPGIAGGEIPAGPREAIKTYQQILEQYPNYERNDKVLYQMSRAYDEIGQPDTAMEVMDRLVTRYPYSKFIDEVDYFRRGEYYFVRKKFLDAEDAYGSVIGMGTTSPYYELALYKLGWTLYKQDLYEEALDNYIAMLDYRMSTGYDFDQDCNYYINEDVLLLLLHHLLLLLLRPGRTTWNNLDYYYNAWPIRQPGRTSATSVVAAVRVRANVRRVWPARAGGSSRLCGSFRVPPGSREGIRCPPARGEKIDGREFTALC